MASKVEFTIEVTTNPDFCGIDAGGVQFAHGAAVITDARMAEWFREHDGYKVTDNKAEITAEKKAAELAKKAADEAAKKAADDKAATTK